MDGLAAKFQTFNDAMYSVGAFLHNWGRLETQITHSMFEIDPASAGPHVNPNKGPRMLESIVNVWFNTYCTRTAAQKKEALAFKEAVLAAAKTRNTICHGFSGIETDPPSFTILCWQQYHQHRMQGLVPPIERYSNFRMTDLCGELGGFARELERLTKVAIDRPKRKPAPAAS